MSGSQCANVIPAFRFTLLTILLHIIMNKNKKELYISLQFVEVKEKYLYF